MYRKQMTRKKEINYLFWDTITFPFRHATNVNQVYRFWFSVMSISISFSAHPWRRKITLIRIGEYSLKANLIEFRRSKLSLCGTVSSTEQWVYFLYAVLRKTLFFIGSSNLWFNWSVNMSCNFLYFLFVKPKKLNNQKWNEENIRLKLHN